VADLVGTMNAKNSLSGNLNAVLGKDGISAYEVAVKNGFEGTETEWLASLKGDPFEYEDFTEEQLNSLKVKGDTGNSGVYLGSGEMPADCNVQIDPNGDADWVIDQTFNPTSPDAQSGIAIEERLKSKVLLDVTLTEEQAGASSVMVEIPNRDLFLNAKQWNVHFTHPYSTEYSANKIYYHCNIRDKNGVAYSLTLASADNAQFLPSGIASWYITVFLSKLSNYNSEGGSFVSFYRTVTPWATSSSANTKTNLQGNLQSFPPILFNENYPPYLEIKNTVGYSFEAGTRVCLEVIL
jgi:hypothetical protein